MLRLLVPLVAWVLVATSACAQSSKAPEPEFERCVKALPLSKQSQARMIVARAGGAGRKVVYEALSAAGRVPQQGGPAKQWTEANVLGKLKRELDENRYKVFAKMLSSGPADRKELLLDLVRVRIDLPRK